MLLPRRFRWLLVAPVAFLSLAGCGNADAPTPSTVRPAAPMQPAPPGRTPTPAPVRVLVPAATRTAIETSLNPPVSSSAAAQLPGAVLGGPEGAFLAALGPTGPDTVAGADDHFARCASGADQYMVTFVSGRATTILRQYCGGTPASAQRATEARAFFPPDAPLAGSPYIDENGEQAWSFVSKGLASIFPASAFQVCQDGTPAGTFELDITHAGWQLGVGRCP